MLEGGWEPKTEQGYPKVTLLGCSHVLGEIVSHFIWYPKPRVSGLARVAWGLHQLLLGQSDRDLVSLGIGSAGVWAFKDSSVTQSSDLAPAPLFLVVYTSCSSLLWSWPWFPESGLCPALCQDTWLLLPVAVLPRAAPGPEYMLSEDSWAGLLRLPGPAAHCS